MQNCIFGAQMASNDRFLASKRQIKGKMDTKKVRHLEYGDTPKINWLCWSMNPCARMTRMQAFFAQRIKVVASLRTRIQPGDPSLKVL